MLLTVEAEQAGVRLDQFLARQFPQYSRVYLRQVINATAVTVDGRRAKASLNLRAGQRIEFEPPEIPKTGPVPEDIPLQVLFEDEHLVVIDKPPGMVVHPGKGNWKGTLASALQFHFNELSSVGGADRPGIVHRLDRDTSGVMAVAKNDAAHMHLAAQFEARTTEKEYFAIVAGRVDRDSDLIDLPIGIHPFHREKMAVRRDHDTSRPAQTFYEVAERLAGYTVVRAKPKTGRTHQIRVHLDSIGCPVLCDKLYGGRSQLTLAELTGVAGDGRVVLARQALHAARLSFAHPVSGERLTFEAPLPDDLTGALAAIREFRPLGRERGRRR
jgi:23S rRNA pseudouridine1911/1915/1917 synthase